MRFSNLLIWLQSLTRLRWLLILSLVISLFLAALSETLILDNADHPSGIAKAATPLKLNTAKVYNTGGLSTSVATGDLNGDNKLDLVTADSTNLSLSIFIGNGDGTFSSANILSLGHDCEFVAVGDFNGDNKFDLVTANGSNNNVSVLLGNGNGTFQAQVNYPSGTYTNAVTVGDVNADGKLDLVVSNFNSHDVSILLGYGNGSFQNALNFPAGTTPRSTALGDFNNDGKIDLAVGNESNDVNILFGNGNGTFQNPIIPLLTAHHNIESVVAGDFNRDGNLDLGLALLDNRSAGILLGKGDGTFQSEKYYNTGGTTRGITLGDFNGDGKLDLATGSENLTILFGNSDGTITTVASYGTGGGVNAVVAGDFNNDSRIDLATSGSRGLLGVAVNIGNGNFEATRSYNLTRWVSSTTTGDFNGDGKLDLVSAGEDTEYYYVQLGNGDGTFQTPAAYLIDLSYPQVAISIINADLNGDSKLDLVILDKYSAGPTGKISVLLGKGDGTFQAAVNYNVGNYPTSVATGDLKGDGKLDLITTNANSNDLSILIGNGDGTFQNASSLPSVSNPYKVIIGDFNKDNRPDLAVITGSGTVSVLLSNGNGIFQTAFTYTGNTSMETLSTSDFNIDGNPDLAIASGVNHSVSIFLGNGDGTFQTAVTYPLDQTTMALMLVVADLNGDGKLDLITGDGNLMVLIGNGDGTFQYPLKFFGAFNNYLPATLVVGDFNQDNIPDLAAAAGWVLIFLNRTFEPVCNNWLQVNSGADDVRCGSLRGAVAHAWQGDTISIGTIANNTINFSSGSITLRPGVSLKGNCLNGRTPGITINGGNTAGDGLILSGNNILQGLKITGFKGREIKLLHNGNQLKCITASKIG